MADLESGLHYLFRIEMATHKTLEGAALRALKDVVIVLAKVNIFSLFTALAVCGKSHWAGTLLRLRDLPN